MDHKTALIALLAISLVLALIGGFVAAKLRLPPLLGYIVAGIACGPHTPGFVGDAELAHQLSEIGVILLMFGVGMHFSLRDLLAVRNVALPGALIQTALVTVLGLALGAVWGWSIGGGLVLGLALAVASTVVLLRALEDTGGLDTIAGRIVVGWLVVEDLLTVVVLVLLPVVAGSLGGPDGAGAVPAGAFAILPLVALTLLKVGAFVAFMLLIGARVLPWLLGQVERTRSRELFTLSVIAIALGVGFGSAELLGLSFALGAFFAGVVVNGSDHSHRAEQDTRPLQDAFAVLFFVSVGMLFDPNILISEPLRVLAALAVVVIAKPVIAWAIMRVLRQSSRASRQVAAGLGQIGEFSFILLALGVSLGVLSQQGQDVALAAALLSIGLNPFLHRLLLRAPARPC
ncbi:MAG: cation:proton antiporter [Proteobacteria bacterium]|nr:cation:proton antiporter [Pseudomonadota bacterium]